MLTLQEERDAYIDIRSNRIWNIKDDIKYWLNRITARESEIRLQCIHEDDYNTLKDFNKELRDENSMLVGIIKDVARAELREELAKNAEENIIVIENDQYLYGYRAGRKSVACEIRNSK